MLPASALSAALDILDDPSMTALARRSPLPSDIGQLLALLPGHAERLGPAAARVGVDPDRLLEAARHYVREVLLHPDADDTRVLGLGPDSRPEHLKQHYRALQAWLHPDRSGGREDDAVLSARVNAAWSRLRMEGQAMLAEEDPAEAGSIGFWPRWRKVELEEPRRPATPWLGIAVGVASLAVVTWVAWPDIDPAPRKATPPATAADLQFSLPVLPQAPAPIATAGAGSSAATTAPEPGIQSTLAQSPMAPKAAPRETPVPAPAPVPAPLRPPPPSSPPPVRAAEADVRERASTPAPTLQAASGPDRIALPVRQAPAPAALQPASLVAAVPAAQVPALPLQELRPEIEAMEAHAEPPVPAVVPSPPAAPPAIDTAREQSARAHAAYLLDYLSRPDQAPPPIWHSGTALDQAERVRQALLAGNRPPVRVLGERATWSFTPEQAQLHVPVESGDPGHGPRTVHASLQWKQEAWWVSQVALEEPR